MNSYNGFTGEQRNRAQRWLNARWASGELQRPKVCVACDQDEGIIDAHAEDYSEPFAAGKTDRYHLCFVCHMMVHCRFKNPEAFTEYCRILAKGGRFKPFASRHFYSFTAAMFGKTALVDQVDAWGAPRADILGDMLAESRPAKKRNAAKAVVGAGEARRE